MIMKYRLVTLIALLLLGLSACSLAEDITPPPGYQSPTSLPTLPPATQTPQDTLTKTPATATAIPSATSAGSEPTSATSDISATPGTTLGTINGNLITSSGSNISEGQKVKMMGFEADQAGSYQKVMEAETSVNADGSYRFEAVEVPLNRVFIVVTTWEGVEYQSDPLFIVDTGTDLSLPLTVYEKTEDLNVLTFYQVHLIFGPPSENSIQVTEVYIVTNPSEQAVYVPTDGTSIPFIQMPESASGVQYQLSQSSAELMNATGGFAMLPGADKQYGFIANFSMPYTKKLDFVQLFSLPTTSLTVLMPQGMRLRSDQLTDAGTQTIQSQVYQMYDVKNLPAGSPVSLKLSGSPGGSTSSNSVRQTWVLIGIGVVGLLLVGVGVTLYLYDRARFKKANEQKSEQGDEAPSEERNNIMDAIIALDEQNNTGDIPKEVYEARRAELIEQLKSAH
jgi:hypothetical protein